MTVDQLISRLSGYPRDLEVRVEVVLSDITYSGDHDIASVMTEPLDGIEDDVDPEVIVLTLWN